MRDAGRSSSERRRRDQAAARCWRAVSPSLVRKTVEHIVHTLLRRYGVVFWRLLLREAAWLPSWREMLRVLRRLEARGDIRGGRFVADVSGEQFALPEAVGSLREARRAPLSGTWVAVSGADPLNLVGVIVPGAKVPALTSNRGALYRDGAAVAALVAGETQWVQALEPREMREAERAHQAPRGVAAARVFALSARR